MRIRLLLDLPVESKHGMTAGRVLEVVEEKRMSPLSRDADRGCIDLYYVDGDAGEEVIEDGLPSGRTRRVPIGERRR
jgi:hypothetical protein